MTRQLSPNIVGFIALALSIVALAYGAGNRNIMHNADTIGFVDFQAVLQQSDAGKSIRDQVEPRRAKLQQAAESKLKELKQEQEDLKKQGNSTEEANAALQKKIDAWNTEAQSRQAELDKAVAPAAQEIEQALRRQVETMADENRLSAVLPMQSAFYANKSLDMTSEAIRRLNKVLSKVEVKFDEQKNDK